jgi:hypothetical protein
MSKPPGLDHSEARSRLRRMARLARYRKFFDLGERGVHGGGAPGAL